MSEFNLENPADVPVVVQIMPLSVYPSPQNLLNTVVPSLLPPDIMSDLIVSTDDVDSADSDVFTLPDLTDPLPAATQALPPGAPAPPVYDLLAALRRAAETTLGMRPHRRTIAMLMQPRSKVTIRVSFQPRDDLPRTTVIVVR